MAEETQIATLEPAAVARPVIDRVAQWHDHLAAEVKAHQISEDTAKTYKIGLRKFQDWGRTELQTTGEVRRRAVVDWVGALTEQGKAVKTISIWLTGVRTFFQWCIREEYVLSDPTAGVKPGKKTSADRHTREGLTDEEALRLLNLASLSTRDRAAVWLMLYTAARGIEVHRANIQDLKTVKENLVLYVQGKGRGDKGEPLLIANDDAVKAIRDYTDELAKAGVKSGPLFVTHRKFNGERRRVSRRTLQLMILTAMKKAGAKSPTKTMHSLRHTALKNALDNGADIRAVQRTARHASQTTTEIYLREDKRIENGAERSIAYKHKDDGNAA
jgi:integrase/recombinase XerD